MKRYIKSEGTNTSSSSDANNLYRLLYQKVLSWENQYLQEHGVDDPSNALKEYLHKSGDQSYMTKTTPILRAFADKEVETMDKVVKFYKDNKK